MNARFQRRHRDRHAEHVRANLVDATAERALVEQPQLPELDNHMGVRHAGALYSGAYEASRALVLAALADGAESVDLVPSQSEVAYDAVAAGPIVSLAEPSGEGWEAVGARGSDFEPFELSASVTSTDANDQVVMSLVIRWRVLPAGTGFQSSKRRVDVAG